MHTSTLSYPRVVDTEGANALHQRSIVFVYGIGMAALQFDRSLEHIEPFESTFRRRSYFRGASTLTIYESFK